MSHHLIERARKDETLRCEIRAAIRRHVAEPRNRAEVRELVRRLSAEPGLARQMERALAEAATRHGLVYEPRDTFDGELSEAELDLVAGGPTAVEYAVMLSLIIVVCIG